MEKSNRDVAAAVSAAMKNNREPAVSVDQKACMNCEHVHMRPDLKWECWKAPPMPVAAWVQDRTGSMNLQVGGARAPVEKDSWCGDFKRKTDA